MKEVRPTSEGMSVNNYSNSCSNSERSLESGEISCVEVFRPRKGDN